MFRNKVLNQDSFDYSCVQTDHLTGIILVSSVPKMPALPKQS